MAAPVGNKFAVGNTGGRPPKFDTREALEAQISAFFDSCREEGIKATVTGLALYLGFCSRSSLDDYAEKGQEFSYTVKRGKLAVENSYELNGQTMDIFALKNMGWKDKVEGEFYGKDGEALVPPSIIVNLVQMQQPKQLGDSTEMQHEK